MYRLQSTVHIGHIFRPCATLARNGFEVLWLRRALGGEVMGTDISETATLFLHMPCLGFFRMTIGIGERRFDFVYTSSLDQVTEPARTLAGLRPSRITASQAWFLVLVLVDPAPGVSP